MSSFDLVIASSFPERATMTGSPGLEAVRGLETRALRKLTEHPHRRCRCGSSRWAGRRLAAGRTRVRATGSPVLAARDRSHGAP
jgi:hypothetical protein